jgi:hypothetical protein
MAVCIPRQCPRPNGACNAAAVKVFSTKVCHFHTFCVIIFGSPCQYMAAVATWPRWLKIWHDFDMAGEKFDMPSGSRTLLVRRLPPVSWQPEQAGSVMRNYVRNAELEQSAGAACSRSLETDVQKCDMAWANSTCPRQLKFRGENPGCSEGLFSYCCFHYFSGLTLM